MALSKDKIAGFKKRLEEELALVEKELGTVGRRNPSNPSDWEAKPEDLDILPADQNELADKIEDYETNSGIVKELEIRYNGIKKALDKITEGKFGTCEVGGEEIEVARLEANPAARTCKKHIEEILPD